MLKKMSTIWWRQFFYLFEFKKNIIGLIFLKIKRRGNINNNDIYGGCGWIQMLNKIIWDEKKN